MASWLSADGVISLLFDDEFGLVEAERDVRDLQESSTDVFAFTLDLQQLLLRKWKL